METEEKKIWKEDAENLIRGTWLWYRSTRIHLRTFVRERVDWFKYAIMHHLGPFHITLMRMSIYDFVPIGRMDLVRII